MFRLFTLLLLASVAASAQTSSSQLPKPAAPPSTEKAPTPGTKSTPGAESALSALPSTAEVPENAPVITIEGLCEGTPALQNTNAQTPCRKQVTRSQFEALVRQFAPTAPRTALRNIAASYARMLTFATAAQHRGIEQEPEFKQRLEMLRLQLMAEVLERKLQAEAANVSDQEIQAYYDAHARDFEEVSLKRLLIPKAASGGASAAAGTTPAGGSTPAPGTIPENAKSVAESIRQRAVAGEDLDKLEKEAYTSLNSKLPPPNVNIGTRRRAAMAPAEQDEVFKLEAGQFTPILEGPGGYTIYKVESRKKVPLETAKEEIKRALQAQHLQERNDAISHAVKTELDEKFFGPEPAKPPVPSGGVSPATSNPRATQQPLPPGHPASSTPPKKQ